MAVSPTLMECFDAHGSSSLIRCQNEAPVSPPTAHQYSFVGDLIISAQGAFQFVANAGTLRSLDFNVGWITGGGWSGSGPGYGVFFHSDSNTGGSNFMETVFGPLSTPPGTQFHIEIDIDTQAGTCVAYENGTAVTRRNFFPGSPHFTPITMVDMQFGYAGDETDPDAFGCAANVGLYAATTTPTGSPYVYLTIASGGTAADFFTNTGGTAGAFAPVGWTPHLCSDCQSPPPPEGGSPKLWLLRQPELHFIGTR